MDKDDKLRIVATINDDYRHNYKSHRHEVPMVTKKGKRIKLIVGNSVRLVGGDQIIAHAVPTRIDDTYQCVGMPIIDIQTDQFEFNRTFTRWKRMTYARHKCSVSPNLVYDELMRYGSTEECKQDAHNNIYRIGDVFSVGKTLGLNEIIRILRDRHDTDDHPLTRCPITCSQLNAFLNFWSREVIVRRLWGYGITNEQIESSMYTEEELYDRVTHNPFTVAFLTEEQCMHICALIGREVSTQDRLNGSLLRALHKELDNGSSYINQNRVAKSIRKYDQDELCVLREEYDILLRSDRYYLKRVYYIELEIRRFFYLHILDRDYRFSSHGTLRKDEEEPPSGELSWKFEYTQPLGDAQKQAIELIPASKSRIVCITGQAGSGKTRVVSEIVRLLRRHSVNFAVLTFTGAASARVNGVLKENISKTFHRSFRDGLDPEIVLIDEASMVSAEVFFLHLYNLGKTRRRRRYIFVGDVNQLTPIGWGRIFEELIESYRCPVMFLDECYRNSPFPGEPDGIIPNAMSLINGSYVHYPTANFTLIGQASRDAILERLKVCIDYGVPPEDVAVICAFKKYGSVEYFNDAIQSMYHQNESAILDNRQRKWYVGDVVVSTVNNYDINVMNGERGRIIKTNASYIEVEYPNVGAMRRVARYSLECEKFRDFGHGFERTANGTYMSTDEIDLGYAFTVHKAQGSEYAHVGFYIDENTKASSHLNCRLAYTGFTRAKTTLTVSCPNGILSEISRTEPYKVRTDFVSLIEKLPRVERIFAMQDDEFY